MINCTETNCPLHALGTLPKFCPECGCQSASKVVVPANACPKCGTDFGDDHPKFCSECGARVAALEPPPPLPPIRSAPEASGDPEKPYGSLKALIEQHEARKASQVLPGRHLTAEETARLERNMRKAPDRRYTELPEAQPEDLPDSPEDSNLYRTVTTRDIPEEEWVRRALPEGSGRTATRAPDGQHRPGSLSARGTKVDASYWSDVRVIPHSFRNKASREREIIGGGRRASGDETMTEEDRAYFAQHPEDMAAFDRLLRGDGQLPPAVRKKDDESSE